MKIVAFVHGYFPNHNAGAEAMLHQILLELKNRGHHVSVLTRNPGAISYEEIPLFEATTLLTDKEIQLAKSADFIFTHLDFTRTAVKLAKKVEALVVHLVHNDRQLAYNKIYDQNVGALAIANSLWIQKTIRKIPSLVVNPPTKPDRYKVKSSKQFITLINMNEAKGGKLFWELARIMPDRQFLGVKGAYGEQIMFSKNLPNVTILENTPEIQSVYAKTKILLVPSSYESWGRVGIEASCSGIPIIANPTPGLTESLGEAGIFCNLHSVADWVEAIKSLDNKDYYELKSKQVTNRAIELAYEFDTQVDVLEARLLELLANRRISK